MLHRLVLLLCCVGPLLASGIPFDFQQRQITVADAPRLSLTKQTTSATPAEMLLVSSAATLPTLADRENYRYEIYVVGRGTVGDRQNKSAFYRLKFNIERTGNFARLVGAVSVTSISEEYAPWDATVSIVANRPAIMVTGDATSTVEWRAWGDYTLTTTAYDPRCDTSTFTVTQLGPTNTISNTVFTPQQFTNARITISKNQATVGAVYQLLLTGRKYHTVNYEAQLNPLLYKNGSPIYTGIGARVHSTKNTAAANTVNGLVEIRILSTGVSGTALVSASLGHASNAEPASQVTAPERIVSIDTTVINTFDLYGQYVIEQGVYLDSVIFEKATADGIWTVAQLGPSTAVSSTSNSDQQLSSASITVGAGTATAGAVYRLRCYGHKYGLVGNTAADGDSTTITPKVYRGAVLLYTGPAKAGGHDTQNSVQADNHLAWLEMQLRILSTGANGKALLACNFNHVSKSLSADRACMTSLYIDINTTVSNTYDAYIAYTINPVGFTLESVLYQRTR